MAGMSNSFKIAQISDTHLFADKHALHCGANVYQNLIDVFNHITSVEQPDVIIFTGDLTQDHTDDSYQQFVDIVKQLNITLPIHYIAGNHDEFLQLNSSFTCSPFNSSKVITNDYWQVLLINSKSETPAGYVSSDTLTWIDNQVDSDKQQVVMMHHHPIDVGYSIDKHGLENKEVFWNAIEKHASIKLIACGHVHNDLSLLPEKTGYSIPLFACPATSIQFDQTKNKSACNGQGAGYRIFELLDDKSFITRTHFIGSVKQESSINKKSLKGNSDE